MAWKPDPNWRDKKPDEAKQVEKLLARKTERRMTDREQLFVLEYMVDLNSTQAAIRAGWEPYEATAQGNKMLRKGHVVSTAVAKALAARSARTGITADRVLREAAKIAFGDPRMLFREDGSLRGPGEYTEDDAAMIESVKTRRIVEVGVDEETGKQKMVPVELQEVKLAGKLGAITLLARHLGLLNDKLEVNVTSLATRLDEAFKRTGRQRSAAEGDEDILDLEAEEVPDLTPEQVEIHNRLLEFKKQLDGDTGEVDLDALLS
jgi:phage terminase small subunit